MSTATTALSISSVLLKLPPSSVTDLIRSFPAWNESGIAAYLEKQKEEGCVLALASHLHFNLSIVAEVANFDVDSNVFQHGAKKEAL